MRTHALINLRLIHHYRNTYCCSFWTVSQLENIRRKHNYLPLIMELLKILARRGQLVPLVEQVRHTQTYSHRDLS